MVKEGGWGFVIRESMHGEVIQASIVRLIKNLTDALQAETKAYNI